MRPTLRIRRTRRLTLKGGPIILYGHGSQDSTCYLGQDRYIDSRSLSSTVHPGVQPGVASMLWKIQPVGSPPNRLATACTRRPYRNAACAMPAGRCGRQSAWALGFCSQPVCEPQVGCVPLAVRGGDCGQRCCCSMAEAALFVEAGAPSWPAGVIVPPASLHVARLNQPTGLQQGPKGADATGQQKTHLAVSDRPRGEMTRSLHLSSKVCCCCCTGSSSSRQDVDRLIGAALSCSSTFGSSLWAT